MAETTLRLTPAQPRGLRLLGHPGAEARGCTPTRWCVRASDGSEIGSIHSESLFHLRGAGLVLWVRGPDGTFDIRQRISDAGRAYLEEDR